MRAGALRVFAWLLSHAFRWMYQTIAVNLEAVARLRALAADGATLVLLPTHKQGPGAARAGMPEAMASSVAAGRCRMAGPESSAADPGRTQPLKVLREHQCSRSTLRAEKACRRCWPASRHTGRDDLYTLPLERERA